MKKLNTYISHVKTLHSLNEFIKESFNFRINRDSAKFQEKIPNSPEELKKIVYKRYTQNKKYLDLTDINVSNLSSFYISGDIGLFDDCNETEIIDVTGWDVSNIYDMTNMFSALLSLKEIKGLETWDVSNVEELNFVFNACYGIEKIDLSSWNISNKLKSMKCSFCHLRVIKEINLTGWDVSGLTQINHSFSHIPQIEEIIGIDNWNVKELGPSFTASDEFNDKDEKLIPKWFKKYC